MAGVRIRSRRLVAVKVVEPGPAGGANAERVQVSLKREVDLLKSIKHPSLVHLKAFGNDASNRALLVINYCPGGDLFEVASTKAARSHTLLGAGGSSQNSSQQYGISIRSILCTETSS